MRGSGKPTSMPPTRLTARQPKGRRLRRFVPWLSRDSGGGGMKAACFQPLAQALSRAGLSACRPNADASSRPVADGRSLDDGEIRDGTSSNPLHRLNDERPYRSRRERHRRSFDGAKLDARVVQTRSDRPVTQCSTARGSFAAVVEDGGRIPNSLDHSGVFAWTRLGHQRLASSKTMSASTPRRSSGHDRYR